MSVTLGTLPTFPYLQINFSQSHVLSFPAFSSLHIVILMHHPLSLNPILLSLLQPHLHSSSSNTSFRNLMSLYIILHDPHKSLPPLHLPLNSLHIPFFFKISLSLSASSFIFSSFSEPLPMHPSLPFLLPSPSSSFVSYSLPFLLTLLPSSLLILSFQITHLVITSDSFTPNFLPSATPYSLHTLAFFSFLTSTPSLTGQVSFISSL